MSSAIHRPHQFIDRFVNQIEGEGPLRILDVGCGLGQTALRLASLGHQVMGISNDEADIETAQVNARRSGLHTCMFEVMDARDIRSNFDQGFFRAVIISDMLHLMSKDDSLDVIKSAKSLTAPKGYNAIWGYLVDPEKSTSSRNSERMFRPGELHTIYTVDPQWKIIDETEDEFASISHMGNEHVSSHAGVIARK